MSYVELPCDFEEEWWEYNRLFILLSHLRSINELNLLISSHTRPDEPPSLISASLTALKGLMVFLSDYCTPDEQKKFITKTLPFIARAAAKLEERAPTSGIPRLEKQENSALVLGRKIVLSLLCNAFLSTFPPLSDCSFNFEMFFASFLNKDERKKKMLASKLRCILCYFERAADEKCNLSSVITYRRQVLNKSELPQIVEWKTNSIPLCPFEIDDENSIENSGGHTLQVGFVSRSLGGGVLNGEHVEEEVRYSICPELLITRLVLENLDDNEAIIVTGTERFADYSGVATTFEFKGEHLDLSERDVFGNLLNSFVAIDSQSNPYQQRIQSPSDFILHDLNKIYIGFLCQQDRGDISTELIALSVKRGSLAFIAEDYPECCIPFNSTSRNSALGNIDSENMGKLTSQITSELTITVPTPQESPGVNTPLSPIPEISEVSHFSNSLAADIQRSGLAQVLGDPSSPEEKVEEFASRLVGSLINYDDQSGVVVDDSGDTTRPPDADSESSSVDALSSALTSSILKTSMEISSNFSPLDPLPRVDSQYDTLARSIITDVLSSSNLCPPPSNIIVTPQTAGEPTALTESVSTMASSFSVNILSDALQTLGDSPSLDIAQGSAGKSDPSLSDHPVIYIQTERRGSAESCRSSRSSSLTGQNITLHEFSDDLADEVLQEGLSVAQFTIQGQAGLDDRGTNVLADNDNLASRSIDDGLLLAKAQQQSDEGSSCSSPILPRKQPPSLSRQGLTLGNSLSSSPVNHKPHRSLSSEPSDGDLETPASSTNPTNSRLLTPISSRTGYAWSIASTRDEDSRPVSPTDMDKIGLSLSNDTDEFSAHFSKIVINHAICNVTGETLSPRTFSSEEEAGQDLPKSSKIGIFLSTLGEAEPPLDGTGTSMEAEEESSSVYNNNWYKMRKQLLRPIATGSGGSVPNEGDPQMKAMVQWMVASAVGRPRLFYYTAKQESVNQLAEVTSWIRSKFWSVGQLCQAVLAFGKQAQAEEKTDLFTFLLQKC